MIPYYLILWSKPDGGTVDLGKYCTEFTVKKGIQSKANVASFTLRVSPLLLSGTDFLDTDGNLRFQMDQNISVYLGTAPINTSTDLLSALTITNVEPEMGENVNIRIDAMDKSAFLLTMSGAKNYTGTAPQIIKDIVNQWSKGSVSALLTTEGGYISATPGGTISSFPTVSYAYVYKPIFDAIDELSQPSYTGDDRPYIFWVDENNRLHWTYPSQTVDNTLEEGKDDIYELKISKKEQEEINMIIYNAGKDKNGNAILWYQFNYSTRSAKLKIAYYDWSEIVAKMQNPGYTWDGLTWNTANNTQIREHAKAIANAKCQDLFARKGLLWKGSVRMKGTRKIERGQLIEITSSKFGKFGEKAKLKLRVTDVTHTVSDRGWFTELTLEEDPLVPA